MTTPRPAPCLVCAEPTSHRDIDGDPVCPTCDDLQDAEPIVDGEPASHTERARLFAVVLSRVRYATSLDAEEAWLCSLGVTPETAASLVRNACRRIALERRGAGQDSAPFERRPEPPRTPNAERLDRIATLLNCRVAAIEERLTALRDAEGERDRWREVAAQWREVAAQWREVAAQAEDALLDCERRLKLYEDIEERRKRIDAEFNAPFPRIPYR